VEDPLSQVNYCAACAKEKGIKAAAS